MTQKKLSGVVYHSTEKVVKYAGAKCEQLYK
jgi:hypothetical protein